MAQVNILIVDQTNDATEGPVLEITDVDPTGKYVLAARVECSRNLEKFSLPKCLPLEQLEAVEQKLESALKYQKIIGTRFSLNGDAMHVFGNEPHNYYTVDEILTGPSGVRTKMAANDLLIPLTESGVHSRMMHGTAWPKNRGVFLSLAGNLAAWINVQEHLRVVCSSRIDAPGNIGEAYGRVAVLLSALDSHLPAKRDPALGFVTSRPSCLGNTLRLQATLRLPRLPRETVQEMCDTANLVLANTAVGDCVYLVRNRQSLGVTEYQTFENFASAVVAIVEQERALAEEKSKHVSTMLKNMFNKRFSKDEH